MPLKNVLNKDPHEAAYRRIKLPWQIDEPIQDALLDPFENLWQFCDCLQAGMREHFSKRRNPR